MSEHEGRSSPHSQWELIAPWIGLVITVAYLGLLFALLATDFYVNQPEGPDVAAAIICAVTAVGVWALAVAIFRRGMQAPDTRTSLDRQTPILMIISGLVFAIGGYLASNGTLAVMVGAWLLFACASLLLTCFGCYLLVLNRRHYWR